MIKESICKEHIAQIVQLKLNVENLKKEKEAFALRFYKIKEENDKLQKEIESLKEDLQTTNNKYTEQKKEHNALLKNRQELLEAFKKIQDENNTLKSQNSIKEDQASKQV